MGLKKVKGILINTYLMSPNPLKLFRAFKLSWKKPFVGSTHFDTHPFGSTSWPQLSDLLQGIP